MLSPAFEHDIFISYGWSGNAIDEGDRAWVAELKNRLRVALRSSLGRDPAIFVELDASRTGSFVPTLERTRLFLFVVTPGSCRSKWCQWEILRFFDRGLSVATSNQVLLPEDRVLGFTLYPMAPFPRKIRTTQGTASRADTAPRPLRS